jgi:hypothetical protein
MNKYLSIALLLILLVFSSCTGKTDTTGLQQTGTQTTESTTSNIPSSSVTPTETTTPSTTTTPDPTKTTVPPASTSSTTTQPSTTTTTSTTSTPTTTSTTITLSTTTTTLTPYIRSYTNDKFHYKISFPSNFTVNQNDRYTVLIDSPEKLGIAILVDKLAVSTTPKAYFDAISAGKKQQLPDWTSSNVTEMKENNVVTGYKYDYSNTVDGVKWLGKGMTIKKGGFGFYVIFTSTQDKWQANQAMAVSCLDSFVLPIIASGAYTSQKLGISFTLPSNWTLIETDSSETLFDFWPPYDGHFVSGQLITATVSSGTTAQQWIKNYADKIGSTDGGIQKEFLFDNAADGYEFGDTLVQGSDQKVVGKMRVIALISGTRVYYFLIVGTVEAMDALSSSVSGLARTMVVTP